MLDVGGGIGTCSFLAVEGGATEAICLDPVAEGATSGTGAAFNAIAAKLAIHNVHIEQTRLQAYVASPGSFDKVKDPGPPAGGEYSTIGYGLFAPFELRHWAQRVRLDRWNEGFVLVLVIVLVIE